jgi:diguanylate cyclase (GGDEF)-like protein
MFVLAIPVAVRLGQLEPLSARPAPFILLVLLFLAVEAMRVDMELGPNSCSITMSEVALVVGVLTGRPLHTVAAQVIAVLVVFGAIRRSPIAKLVFNVAEVSLISGIGVLVMRSFDPGTTLSTRVGIGALAAGLVVGVLDLFAVTLVSRLAGHRMIRVEFGRQLGYAAASSVASAAIGVQMVFLGRESVWLVTLAAVPVALMYAAFRSYASQRRAAERNEFLHRAAIALHDAPNLDDGLLAMLEHARAAVRAQFSRVVLFTPDGTVTVAAHVDPTVNEAMVAASPEMASAAQLLMHELRAAVLLDSGELAGRALLSALDVDDGIAVPLLRNGHSVGILLVGNRLGDYDEFRDEDVRLVELVANQIGVALEKGRLEQSIRQLVELESKLHHQANHDHLTGIANRRLFNERIEHLFARRDPTGVALILIDLDDFKAINDTHGHVVGDEVLAVVAQRLHAGVRSGDLVARIGGDEFALVLHGVDSTATALQRAASVVEAVRRPAKVHDRVLSVRTSIGVAVADRETRTPGDLLRNADTALYRAKALGKDSYVLFEASMHSEAAERHLLADEITTAVRQRQFDVVYLPVVDLVTGDIVAAEALVRWNHPVRGAMVPSEFLDLTAEIGLSAELGEVVIATAVRDFAGLSRLRLDRPPLRLNLNLAREQVADPNLVDRLVRLVRSAGLDPKHVTLEAGEAVFLADEESTRRTVISAKAHGIHLALDDFGVGYSALGHVHELALDELKIDGSLVQALGRQPRTSALVGSIVHFANALDLTAVAEGIETVEQLTELRRRGCRFGQGYLMSPPLSATELGETMFRPRVKPSWVS